MMNSTSFNYPIMPYQKKLSLISKLATTDDIEGALSPRNNCMIVCFVVVFAPHLEVLEAKTKVSGLASNRVKSTQVSILKGDVSLVSLIPPPELLHSSCYELVCGFGLSQGDAFLLLTYLVWRPCSLEALVVSFSERVVVIVVICSKLERRLVSMFFDPLRDMIVFRRAEKALERSGIAVGMIVGVLELMEVADKREVFAIVMLFGLEGSNALEDASVRLINFHKLQIYARVLQRKSV